MSDAALPLTADYLNLLHNQVPMIDVRAPVEFESGALPFAKNLPLLENDERRDVGTCYKRHGQDAAVVLGHKLVSGSVKEARVQAWKTFVNENPTAVLYCARGGLRSKLSQQWLADAGVECPKVEGGFKSIRGFLLSYLEEACRTQSFVLLSGMTGTSKTEMIKELNNSVDLEGLANHKGSSFGRPLDEQPAQIDFENALILKLMKLSESGKHRKIVLEDESHHIGGRHLPLPLRIAMKDSPKVIVELSFEERLEKLWQEYVVDRHASTVAFHGDVAEQAFSDYLNDSLFRIRKRLGLQRTKDIQAKMTEAIERQHEDGFASHRKWLEEVTANYYDPMYRYQLDKHKERVVFSGSRQEVMQWLAENS